MQLRHLRRLWQSLILLNSKGPLHCELSVHRGGGYGCIMEITIQRPEVLNALNRKAHAELADAFDRFAENSALNISVLRGSGERAFVWAPT